MISTIAMIRLGKTFGNLMVDVVATNDKLRARVRRIVAAATGAAPTGRGGARRGRRRREGRDRPLLAARSTPTTARARLEAAGGVVRKALAP